MASSRNGNSNFGRIVPVGLAVLLLTGIVGSIVMGIRAKNAAIASTETQATAITERFARRWCSGPTTSTRSPRAFGSPTSPIRSRTVVLDPERLRRRDPVVARGHDPVLHRRRPHRQPTGRRARSHPGSAPRQAAERGRERKDLRHGAARVRIRRRRARRRRGHPLRSARGDGGRSVAHQRDLHRLRAGRRDRPAALEPVRTRARRAAPGDAPSRGTLPRRRDAPAGTRAADDLRRHNPA